MVMKDYHQEIKNYAGTWYAQTLKFTEQMIYQFEWVKRNEPISNEFFWDQFYKNEQAFAIMVLMKHHNLSSWRDIRKIPLYEIDSMVAKQIMNMKNSSETQQTREQDHETMGLLMMIRMQMGNLPASQNKSAKAVTLFLLLVIICLGALSIAIPLLGIPLLILLGYVGYVMFWPKV